MQIQLLLVASFIITSYICQKKGELSLSSGGRKRMPRRAPKARGGGKGEVRGGAGGTAQRDAAGDTHGGSERAGGGERMSPRDDTCRNSQAAHSRAGHWARDCRQPRRGQAHVVQVAVDDEPTLFLVHKTIEQLPTASTVTALYVDEPRARVFLVDGSSDDKIDGWFLHSGATHHMTGRREFFSNLNSNVRGSVKFSDFSGVDIKGIGSVILVAKSGEHRLLSEVFYIPALRNSIISLG